MKRSASFLLFLFLCQSAYASIAFENLASISRDPAHAHRALKQAEINQYSARPALAAAFAGEAFNKIGDYAMKQAANGDKGWEDGGAKKVLAHAVIGAITAQISDGKALAGALGAGAREGMSGLTAGSSDLTQQIVSTGIGAAAGAVGGSAGAGAVTAWNGERFNRQLHQREIAWIKGHAANFAAGNPGMSIEQAKAALTQQALRQTDFLWSAMLGGADDTKAATYLADAQGGFVNTHGKQQKLFVATGDDFMRAEVGLNALKPSDQAFYREYALPGRKYDSAALAARAEIARLTREKVAQLKDMTVQDALNVGKAVAESVWDGLKTAALHPIDTTIAVGDAIADKAKSLGEQTAAATVSGDKLNSLYGVSDAGTAQKTIAAADVVATGAAALGAGKVVSVVGKKVAEKIGERVGKGNAPSVPVYRIDKGSDVNAQGARASAATVNMNPLQIVPKKYRAEVAAAFDGKPEAVTLKEDLIVYRHWGGVSGETGSPWVSPKPYAKPGNAKRYLALPEKNTAQNLTAFRIPAGTTILRGKVASKVGDPRFDGKAVGSGVQIYVPAPMLLEKIK